MINETISLYNEIKDINIMSEYSEAVKDSPYKHLLFAMKRTDRDIYSIVK